MDVSSCLKDIPYVKEPLLFPKYSAWNIIGWDVNRWRDLLTEESEDKLILREGVFKCSQEPSWERKCSSVEMNVGDFFQRFVSNRSDETWLYFDYRHILNFSSSTCSKLGFTWGNVGFPDKAAKDSTIWIGTAGAHTPCHVDTYGCNFVTQVFGKKRWILFPPTESENLKPTRVPYEESSVYSSYNFFRGCAQYPEVKEAIMIDLEPKDVLYVPNGWWHYVENLTPAISTNIWIPMPSDDESRVKECLVKYFVRSVVNNLSPAEKEELLNPNEDDLSSITPERIEEELRWCRGQLQPVNNPSSVSLENIKQLVKTYGLPRTPIQTIKSSQNVPHECTISDDRPSACSETLNLINAFCHPDVINLATNKYLKLDFPVHNDGS